MNENNLPAKIEDLLHNAYLQYSLSVNVGRAIPDVRDGLKPGMRRVLYAMKQQGLTKNHSYMKCARVVGDVIGKYHPHGDSSVYDTMVRMAQDFSMRYPLVDGQGNFGSIDGDSPAAYRYTECRMEKLAEELLSDLDKKTVEFSPNFDDSETEPDVLPAGYPNLLVNGTSGIGVGMATSIPPHNLRETIDAAIAVLDNSSITTDELIQIIPGPDFPTKGTIIGVNNIRKLYETGHGTIRLQGTADIEEKNDKDFIIITEIPYAVKKEDLVKAIANLVNEKVINGISSLNDESSSRTGIRIVIGIKRGHNSNIVLNQLYKHTRLALSIGCQFLVVDKKRPRTLSLKQILQSYLNHRLEVITNRIKFELDKALKRSHILEGLLIAVNNIDKIIELIKKSASTEKALHNLMNQYSLTKRQASAILEMRLRQLTALAIDDLQTEYDLLKEKITLFEEQLANASLRWAIVKEELQTIRNKYSDERKTRITTGSSDINFEDLINPESIIITISNQGYIKRLRSDTYKTQHRGGKGIKAMETKDNDYLKYIHSACTHDYILFFTNKGKMHWLKGYDIPEANRTSKGRPVVNLLEFEEGEQIRSIITTNDMEQENKFIFMATKNGIIKKTQISAYKNLRKAALKAIVLDEGDDLIETKLADNNNHIVLSSTHGMACHFTAEGIRNIGRVCRGVRGINLKENDSVVAMSVVKEDDNILVISKGGMGKRSLVANYRLTKRGGKGVRNINLNDNDEVIQVMQVDDEQELLITTREGQIVRIKTDAIRVIGRVGKGVKIMSMKIKNDTIVDISKVAVLEEDEDEKKDENNNQETE